MAKKQERGGAGKLSALQMLAALDVDELQATVDEKRKEVDALEVLLKAAITRRDGATKRGPKGRRAAAEDGQATAPGELTEEQTDLRAKIVDALTGVNVKRIDHLAEELGVEKSQLVEIMQNDEAFERRGPAYWALAGE